MSARSSAAKPASPPPSHGYPLIFFLHHSGGNTRDDFRHYARVGLKSGYAVFRWDKRGTGRSGAGGRGSSTQDAINAYESALELPMVNRNRAVILAQCSGTQLLGGSFGQFACIAYPYGVILAGNKLDEQAILAIDARIHILIGEEDWTPWQRFARAACKAHNAVYEHGASYYVAPQADRLLMDTRMDTPTFQRQAEMVLEDWLTKLCPPSRSTLTPRRPVTAGI
jgi:pimeloyl-ACP methyl ester carboxylesterase